MSQLPGAVSATVPDAKITQYLLNPNQSARAAGKAKFFALHGFSQANAAALKKALLEHPLNNPVTKHTTTSHGEKFEVSCSLATPDGRNPCIVTVWIIQPTDPNPRFVTAYANPP